MTPEVAATAVRRVDLDMLLHLAERADADVSSLRHDMLKPHPRKNAPAFNGSQLADLCGIDPKRVTHLSRRGDLPPGTMVGSRRMFTLQEARVWIAELGQRKHRPEGARAAVIACVNFKGGSTKTTTAFNLAQALTLRSRRVLLVDLDPQASATTLTGLLPAAEVMDEHTVAPITYPPLDKAPQDLGYAVQSTYWDGLDLIPAAPQLFNAEILLPIHSRNPSIKWWGLLDKALDPLRDQYDVIIIDTAPSLSYLAINAVIAADALLMPVPPDNLDYLSSVSFWSMLSETMSGLLQHQGVEKSFAFIRVLLSRVDNSESNKLVKQWISQTYAGHMAPVEIPRSSVNTVGAVQFASVYDITKYEGDRRTYAKVRAAFDGLADHIDDLIETTVWAPAAAAAAQL
jgi:chromosome partitioning protein